MVVRCLGSNSQVGPFFLILTPKEDNTCPIVLTSTRVGILWRRHSCSHKRVPAISARAEFFAPLTFTSPLRVLPPTISRTVCGVVSWQFSLSAGLNVVVFIVLSSVFLIGFDFGFDSNRLFPFYSIFSDFLPYSLLPLLQIPIPLFLFCFSPPSVVQPFLKDNGSGLFVN